MRLEIDTNQKTIKVLDYAVTVGDLIKELAKLFPEEGFMEYTIISVVNNPLNIPTTTPYVPPNPWGVTPIYGTSPPTTITETLKMIKNENTTE